MEYIEWEYDRETGLCCSSESENDGVTIILFKTVIGILRTFDLYHIVNFNLFRQKIPKYLLCVGTGDILEEQW